MPLSVVDALTPVERYRARGSGDGLVRRAMLGRGQLGPLQHGLALIVPVPGLPRFEAAHVPVSGLLVVAGRVLVGGGVAAPHVAAAGRAAQGAPPAAVRPALGPDRATP